MAFQCGLKLISFGLMMRIEVTASGNVLCERLRFGLLLQGVNPFDSRLRISKHLGSINTLGTSATGSLRIVLRERTSSCTSNGWSPLSILRFCFALATCEMQRGAAGYSRANGLCE